MQEAAETLLRAAQERPDDAEAQLLASLAAAAVGWDEAAQEVLAKAEYAGEGFQPTVLHEVEERIALGAEASATFLRDTIGASVLHERLTQPL